MVTPPMSYLSKCTSKNPKNVGTWETLAYSVSGNPDPYKRLAIRHRTSVEACQDRSLFIAPEGPLARLPCWRTLYPAASRSAF